MKSRILRTAALTAVALTAGAGLSACSQDGGTQTLQVQTGFSAGSEQLNVLTDIAQKFEAAHPGVALDLIPSTTSYEQDIKVKLASKDAPDIWMTHGWSRDRYADFLAPLQDEAWAKDVNPILDASMRNDQGEIFALPVIADVAGIVYNADVLQAAGVDPASVKTWDDFNAAAAKIKANGVSPIVLSGKESGPAGNLIDWQAPGVYTDAQLEALKAGTFDNAAYEPMLATVQGWQQNGYINPDYSSATKDDVSKALGGGKAAFVFSQNGVTADALAAFPNAKVGFMPIPSKTGSPYLIGGEGQATFGAAANGAHLDTAKQFLAFLAQPDNMAALAKAAGAAPGLLNVPMDLGPLQASYDTWVTQAKLPLQPYFDRVWLPNGMWNTLVTTTDSVITGQATPAAATEQVAQSFAGLYGKAE